MPSSDKARKIARRQDADVRAIEREAMREARRFAVTTRAQAMRMVRQGLDPSNMIRRRFAELAPTLTRTMVAGHLTGSRRAAIQVTKHKRKAVALAAFDDTITFLQRRLGADKAAISALSGTYGGHALGVVGGMGDAVAERVQKAILDATLQGLHGRDGIALVREAFDAAGVTVDKPHLLETVFRTETSLAYSAGASNAMADPAIDEILWGYEYVTVGDDRVRPEHQALDGFRAKKDDPIWNTHNVPNGWNCRCTRVAIFIGDEEATESLPPDRVSVEVDGETVEVEPGPDDDWGFDPGKLFRELVSVN
jgi:SPP1 gp7 family putative phage head morphogenesis protein